MTTFPGSPKLLKGGIVLIDPETASGAAALLSLQYNPDSLTPHVARCKVSEKAAIARKRCA